VFFRAGRVATKKITKERERERGRESELTVLAVRINQDFCLFFFWKARKRNDFYEMMTERDDFAYVADSLTSR